MADRHDSLSVTSQARASVPGPASFAAASSRSTRRAMQRGLRAPFGQAHPDAAAQPTRRTDDDRPHGQSPPHVSGNDVRRIAELSFSGRWPRRAASDLDHGWPRPMPARARDRQPDAPISPPGTSVLPRLPSGVGQEHTSVPRRWQMATERQKERRGRTSRRRPRPERPRPRRQGPELAGPQHRSGEPAAGERFRLPQGAQGAARRRPPRAQHGGPFRSGRGCHRP